MEGRSAVWLLAALLLLEALISAEAQNSLKYLEVGGKLLLRPEPFTGSIRSITWRLNDDIVGVLDEGLELMYAPAFKDRARVNTTTGVLEISNMMKNDSGVYKVTINNRIQVGGHNVRVIKQVPDPHVRITPLTCSKESESCSLSCDGDVTDAGPVTFYFKGDGDYEEVEKNIKMINKDTKHVETLSCRMKNPLGQKDSEPVNNPFYEEPSHWKTVVGVLGGLAAVGAVVAAVVGGGVYYNKQQKSSNGTGPTTNSSNNNANHPDRSPLNDMHSDSKEDVEKL